MFTSQSLKIVLFSNFGNTLATHYRKVNKAAVLFLMLKTEVLLNNNGPENNTNAEL